MATTTPNRYPASPFFNKQLQRFGATGLITLFALILALVFLMPFGYGGITAFKDKEQITRSAKGSILPLDPSYYTYPTFEYDGETLDVYEVEAGDQTYQWALVEENKDTGQATYVDIEQPGELITVTSGAAVINSDVVEDIKATKLTAELEIFKVPMEDGSIRELAAVNKTRKAVTFVDPDNPEAGTIEWEGRWRELDMKMVFAPRTGNFKEAWNIADFPLLFRNTLAIAAIGLTGTLISSVCVAYAFSRFPIPGKNIIFLVLIGTIILPSQVRLVPTYAFFSKIGWTGTWLPLTVPHFFANAYNVFLLRQYFMTLPREMDEAAMIDGAGPLTILMRIIIPQSWPVIVAVGLFHFVYAWNDYFEPMIYLLGNPDKVPISVGIQQFNFIYDQQPHLIQATSLLALVVPVAIFFFAQRFFMQGVVITGVEK